MQRKNEQPLPLKTTDDRRKKGKKPVNPTVNLETEQEQAAKSFRSCEDLLNTKYKNKLESSYKIDHVEFERHAAGGSNMHYFDLLIRLKNEQEHLFRKIQMNEYDNLLDFISSKGFMAPSTLHTGVEGDEGQDCYYISKLNALRVEMHKEMHNLRAEMDNKFACINAKID